LLLLALATGGLVEVADATNVSGNLTTQTWTKANSPYRVTGSIAVPSGNTLTIEPGVDVLFDSTAQIFVSGRIVAIGTETDSIRFLKGTTDWRGIRISGGDTSTLAYVRISGSISTVFSGPNGAGIGLTGANTRLGVAHSVISGNQNGMSGGGIAVGDSARLTMVRSAIRDNYCQYAGGGILNAGYTSLSDCLISGNVPSGGFYGGGIYNTGTLAAKGCTITANRAGHGGAGIYNEPGGTVDLDNSVVSANRSWIQGGGFANYGTMRVTRCLVINNLANEDWPEGAGARNGGSLTVANCTFYGNSGGNGNAITHAGGTTELVNTIIWGNAAPQLKGFDQPGVTVTYSNIQQDAGVFPGTGNINVDPQFADPANQDFRLWPGSPCIDAGDPASPLDPDGSPADMGGAPVFQWSSEITTTTWRKARSPYRIPGTVTVPAGHTLTIEPGVDVLFDADVPFAVRGRLQAIGTETDSIRFLPGTAASWRGIRFSDADSSTLAYVRVSGAYARESDPGGHGIEVVDSGTRIWLSNSVLSHNDAGTGGGLATGSGTFVTLQNVTISDNHAVARGGGIQNRGEMVAIGSRITRNVASGGDDWPDSGGFGNFGTMTLTNCAIYGNTGQSGGGAFTNVGALSLVNCTVTGNHPASRALWLTYSGASATFQNSIVWGDRVENWGGSIAATYSNIQQDAGVFPGTGNINADPLFVDAANGDFRLQPGSPCIDAGDPASPMDPDWSRVDMGAFPFVKTGTTVAGQVATATWTNAASPYRVTGAVTVPSGATLTMEPGVAVLFDSTAPFLVQGALRAIGTEADSIRFVPGVAAEWRGLRFSGGDSSALAFVRVSGGYARGETREDSCGGGFHLSGAGTRVTVSRSVISGNASAWSGAGIKGTAGAKGVFTDCVITDNHAEHDGGGLYNTELADITFANCLISRNTAGDDGGGMDNSNGIITLTGCTVTHNSAFDDAGGVGNHGTQGRATITRCVIAKNTCGVDGGGLRPTGGAILTMTNCTVADNVSTNGGGLYNESGAVNTLVNCILWGNTTPGIFNQSGTVGAQYSCIAGGWTGFGNIASDPLFVDAANDDYRLLNNSPCVDTGDPASPPDPDGSRANMGACPARREVGVAFDPRPVALSLSQNAPNPFNPSTTIRFSLPEAGYVTLMVYDINGRLVRTLVGPAASAAQTFSSGHHEVIWDGRDANGRDVASGVYIYRLAAKQGTVTRRMVLAR